MKPMSEDWMATEVPDDMLEDEFDDFFDMDRNPAELLGINAVQDNEVGRVKLVFLDKNTEREVGFVATDHEGILEIIFDALEEEDGYSSFIARMMLADGTCEKTMNLSVNYMEQITGESVRTIINAVRTPNYSFFNHFWLTKT
jgi:hypothetical protein